MLNPVASTAVARLQILKLNLVIFGTRQLNQPAVQTAVIDLQVSSYRWTLDSPVILAERDGTYLKVEVTS